MFHPATLLLAWAGCALCAPLLPLWTALAAAALATVAALAFAAQRTRRLIRRARWLLLSLFLLFAFATPGVLLAGWPGRLGITEDGLVAAGEHLARLLLLLVTLALVHERLGNRGLLSGLYCLMRPLAGVASFRDRAVVRLMLVVDFVEAGVPGGWRRWLEPADDGPDSLTLDRQPMRPPDWCVLALLGVGGTVAWAW